MTAAQSCFDQAAVLFGEHLRRESENPRSLDLLDKIETTVRVLSVVTRRIGADADEAALLRERLDELPVTVTISKADEIVAQFEHVQENIERLHAIFHQKRAAAVADDRLLDHDGVVDAFDEAISACRSLHIVLEGLRWAIIEHNIDAEDHVGQEENLLRTDADVDEALDRLLE